jgi:4-hydroxy-3-methylbut-2-enyl diphosphate reductase IspH
MTHVLCIGATGMLAGCVRSLIADGDRVTCIARTELSLDQLRATIDLALHNRLTTFQCDYRDAESLTEILAGLNPDAAICWIHSPTEPVLEAIRAVLPDIDLLQVVGSSSSIPTTHLSSANRFVRLGFVIDENRSRWLTNSEISSGVRRAYLSGERESLVGIIEPWDKKP